MALLQDLGRQGRRRGLETAEQVEVLRTLGCPLGAGYHFSRPLGAGDAVKLLLTGQKPTPSMLVPA